MVDCNVNYFKLQNGMLISMFIIYCQKRISYGFNTVLEAIIERRKNNHT